MPKPNCTGQDELDLGVIDFGRLGRREVQGCFDGGSMTSDAGVMLTALRGNNAPDPPPNGPIARERNLAELIQLLR